MAAAGEVTMGFLVLNRSTEDLLIGKPSLDRCGFVSDRESIELRSLGVRFPTILPGEQDDPKTHLFLRCSDHALLEPRPGLSSVKTLEFTAPREVQDKD